MRLTQGHAFSFLPDLTDAQIRAQIEYCLAATAGRCRVEYTDDPHPRNTYWEMFGMPMFDLQGRRRRHGRDRRLPQDLPEPLRQGERLRFDARLGDAAPVVHRQPAAATSRASRSSATRSTGRSIRYTTRAYATDAPEGERY